MKRMSRRSRASGDAALMSRWIIADELGRSSTQVAINWVRSKPGVIPIIGSRKAHQIEDSLGCLDFELSEAHRERLDAVSAVPLGFPHDFLARADIRDIVYGDQRDRIRLE